jgi:cytoskeletal protein RodZ
VSIGDTLAEGRRQAGLTTTQVSQQTRIRESIVRAIEQGDFSLCGGNFYARGHVKSIAEVVGVDPVPLIREYDEEHGPPSTMRASQIFEPATPIRIREPRNLHLGRVLAVMLLAVIGYGAYHVISTRDNHASATTPAATIRPVAKAKPKVTATPAATHSAAPATGEAVITLTASSDCWVGIDSPTGQQISQSTIPAGQTMTWNEKHPVSIVIGNPPAVQVTVNGKPEQISGVNVVTLHINPSSKTPVTTS